jgi:hypothetical protein
MSYYIAAFSGLILRGKSRQQMSLYCVQSEREVFIDKQGVAHPMNNIKYNPFYYSILGIRMNEKRERCTTATYIASAHCLFNLPGRPQSPTDFNFIRAAREQISNRTYKSRYQIKHVTKSTCNARMNALHTHRRDTVSHDSLGWGGASGLLIGQTTSYEGQQRQRE